MSKYLLIDGNNLGFRCAFANSELKNKDGLFSGVHYGVFQSLIGLRERFDDFKFLIIWDSKSARRITEAQAAVDKGLIKSGYKENRKPKEGEEADPIVVAYKEQLPYLKQALDKAGFAQIRLDDYEADDVIASYANALKGHTVVLMTSDKDFYQTLDDHVSIWNGMKSEMVTKEDFINKNKIQPHQHIDCGALMGDAGDNIFGIPGWGEVTALKAIAQYGSWQNVLDEFDKKYSKHRENYPDLEDEAEFKELASILTKSGKPKYPEIHLGMPYTGVALALERKKIKSIPKAHLMALMFRTRIELAYSLKKIDNDIEDLPDVVNPEFDREKVVEYFKYFDIMSLVSEVDKLREGSLTTT